MSSTDDRRRFAITLPFIPPFDLPLALLCQMGGASKATARKKVQDGSITAYRKGAASWVTTEEMARMARSGIIRIVKR